MNTQTSANSLNDNASVARKAPVRGAKSLPWIVAAVLLVFTYLLASPWIAVLLVACNPAVNGDTPGAKTVEAFLYPAMLLAEIAPFYNEYFMWVLWNFNG
jgi:hypothetical protein